MHEVSFYEASKALFDYRDQLRKMAAEWLDLEMLKQPIIVLVPGGMQPRTVPPLPENIAEAMRWVEADIHRLREFFRDRAARRRYYERHGT